jgi:hypothetical protein
MAVFRDPCMPDGSFLACAPIRFSAMAARRFARPSLIGKKIPVFDHPKSNLQPRRPGPKEGRIAIVTDVGLGCGGRGSVVAREHRRAGRKTRERSTGARTNGAYAYGKAVWSWHPLLVSSWRRLSNPTGFRSAANLSATVTRRIRRRGERHKPLKPLRGECRSVSAEPVCSCAFLYALLHTRPRGAARTRHSLRPLFLGKMFLYDSGGLRREIAASRLTVMITATARVAKIGE